MSRAKPTPHCRNWFFALLLACGTVHAEPFQLKGIAIGSKAAAVCRDAAVTDKMGEIIRSSRPAAPSLIEMGTTECEVDLGSFGGSKLANPAKLLFLDDRLILIKIELDGLALAKFVDIYKSFLGDYGKAVRITSRPFVTDTWKASRQTLVLERLGRSWDDNDVTIILKDDDGYRTYDTRSTANAKLLERLDLSNVRKDIR